MTMIGHGQGPEVDSRRFVSVNVVGCGDLVRNRLLPALAAVTPTGNRPWPELQSVRFLSNDTAAPAVTGAGDLHSEWHAVDSPAMLRRWLTPDQPVIIATPSFAHVGYVEVAAAAGALVAVEKPLTCLPAELRRTTCLVAGPARRQLYALSVTTYSRRHCH